MKTKIFIYLVILLIACFIMYLLGISPLSLINIPLIIFALAMAYVAQNNGLSKKTKTFIIIILVILTILYPKEEKKCGIFPYQSPVCSTKNCIGIPVGFNNPVCIGFGFNF